jgi:hypothetical protein
LDLQVIARLRKVTSATVPARRYRGAVTEQAPTLVDLPQPRALTEAEHALVTRLAAFADVPTLSEQIETVLVVSTCDCGCASVGLRTEGPQVPATRHRAAERHRARRLLRRERAGVDDVSIVLHVLSGFVGELEIFAGEGVAVPAPPVQSVTDVWIH